MEVPAEHVDTICIHADHTPLSLGSARMGSNHPVPGGPGLTGHHGGFAGLKRRQDQQDVHLHPQIALVELKRQHPDTYKHSHPRAYKLGQVAAIDDNIEKFLMGRQVSVVCLVFFAAKLTTIHGRDEDGFLFPVPEVVQTLLLETGLLACVIVVIVAQLVPQIVASQYPVQFMQLFVNMPAYYTCIALEMTGITHFTWVLAHLASLGMDKDFERGETGSHDTRPTGNNNGSKDDIPGHTRGNQNVAYCQEV